MTTYYPYSVHLSDGQKENLAKAYKNSSSITIRLASNELTSNDQLMLTRTQIKKIKKAIVSHKGVDMKTSKTLIRKTVKYGGTLWLPLFSLGTKLLPMASRALPYATKALSGLATGAMNSLVSLAMDKISGRGQTGG